MGKEVGDTEQWIFPEVTLTADERREILAAVTRLMVELMFDTHIYTFGGKLFKQAKGGPIGLRGTCALARLVMNVWDSLWEEELTKVLETPALKLWTDRLLAFRAALAKGKYPYPPDVPADKKTTQMVAGLETITSLKP